ncbi:MULTISPECIES: restriction endonuclease subunit S [Bacillus]|uniref:restriction endonuclease subunit S n=1 Tax=Bacillus TaxID=1386 RepID=UPI0002EA0975|nr:MULTISPECIES: restriction endonuclease subunit S [Bacillus]
MVESNQVVRDGYKMTELGEIPVEWELVELAKLAKEEDRYSFCGGPFGSDLTSTEYTDSGVQIIQLQNIGDGSFNSNYKIYTSEEKADSLKKCNIFPGEIVIAKMAEPVARACIIPDYSPRFLMASDAIRLSPDIEKVNTVFLMYAINSNYFRKMAELNSTGTTRLRIGLTTLAKLNVIYPTLLEQQKIAEILSTVDEQIENTKQLIEKTKELKKGLMQQLLTKGIGHTEFKQTELGEIPVEWEIQSLVNLMEAGSTGVKRGPFGGALKKEYFVEEGFAVYEQQHVIYNQFNNIRYFISREKFEELNGFEILSGDILISCSGTVGRVTIVPDNIQRGVMNQALLRFRPKIETVDSVFLYYLLTSDFMQAKMLDMTHGSTIKNMVAVSEIKEIKIGLPSKQEQQKIASILSSVNEQIESYEQEKEKYLELKKGLMQQLLTGKIRVTV